MFCSRNPGRLTARVFPKYHRPSPTTMISSSVDLVEPLLTEESSKVPSQHEFDNTMRGRLAAFNILANLNRDKFSWLINAVPGLTHRDLATGLSKDT